MIQMTPNGDRDELRRYPLLSRISSPGDLSTLTSAELVGLAQEIRAYLIASVAKTGGHLGPNLGIVEVALAVHRIFESPRDTIIWDTGHQAYVHKMLTGRKDFSNLRREGGLSGYPSRAESVHDVVENSHATTALSWANGVALEKKRMHIPGATVAVIGDGALTGGMAWEAVNNIAQGPKCPIVIVINDNGRSYAPTVGGLAQILDALRTSEGYEETLKRGKSTLLGLGRVGHHAYDALHGLKAGLKDVLAPQSVFQDSGIKYIGPVDGHDEVAMELALERAKSFGEPVIVHAITEKGRGYTPAEEDIADRFHAVGEIHPETGLPVAPARFGWTKVFAEHLLSLAERDPKIVGVTAAMMAPVGLQPLATRFPNRVIDVGIAEQHGFTAAAGMAFEGAHPVVCVYATFMNRAFDQLLMDVSLHSEPVTIVLDRAGVTGDDGASHNGMWDLSLAAMVPNLKVAAPRDASTLREELSEAVQTQSGPTLVRFPKGEPPGDITALRSFDGSDVVFERSALDIPESQTEPSVLIISVGSMVPTAIAAAKRLVQQGHPVTVVDPRWVLPVRASLVEAAKQFDVVVSVEDGLEVGGVGSELGRLCATAGAPPVQILGIPRAFLEHKTRAAIMKEVGLDEAGIVRAAKRGAQRVTVTKSSEQKLGVRVDSSRGI